MSFSDGHPSFRIDLASFRGPLDLLLYLVRKREIPVTDIPIADITEQYIEYLDVLQQLDVNEVGDFLELASTLVEIKSRMVLPIVEEGNQAIEDPREELVQRLLEYKNYRDAASLLEEQSRDWQEHYPRLANDVPERRIDPADQPIREVELWDLVSAIGRIIRDRRATATSNIVYDDTPIQTYMTRIHSLLVEQGRVCFSDLFEADMHKSAMIGVFLAILELVRHHSVTTQQNDSQGEIWVVPGSQFTSDLEVEDPDNFDPSNSPQTT